jgi:hypothetical protein
MKNQNNWVKVGQILQATDECKYPEGWLPLSSIEAASNIIGVPCALSKTFRRPIKENN